MEFKYAPMFQLGKDETEYYLLTKDYVSVGEFEGHEILKVQPEALTLMAQQAFHDVSFMLRRSHNEQVAKILRGKHKPTYTPFLDTGDNVIIVNAEKIRLTGKKMTDRVYTRYTGYPGGQRFTTPREILASRPEELIRKSVRGMLPKTRLGDKLINNLYIYAGPEHKQQAQNPKQIKFNEI